MKRTRTIKVLGYGGAGLLLLALAGVAGCVRVSGGTWYVRSAPVPEDWPELTPVGTVQVKAYPAYRAAVVADADLDGAGGMRPMFMALFRHIQANEISMTAPVEMGYAGGRGPARMERMAFLYRTGDLGALGTEGAVRVRDVAPRTFASVGVRGDYTARNFDKGLAALQAWLEANPGRVVPAGPPRYLGYNGPVVPKFMRYGEVQIPVTEG